MKNGIERYQPHNYYYMDYKNIQYYNNPRIDILQHIPNNTQRVLDIGCGSAALGIELKSNLGDDIEVVGIEQNYEVAKTVKNKIDKIIIGNIEEINIPYNDGYFDCIICADVLEHLIDPWQLLTRLKLKLNDEGCILASIPNIANYKIIKMLKKEMWHYEDAGIMDRTHLRFFTKSTIIELFVQSDLTPIIVDKIMSGNKYRQLYHKIINNDICVSQFIIKATKIIL